MTDSPSEATVLPDLEPMLDWGAVAIEFGGDRGTEGYECWLSEPAVRHVTRLLAPLMGRHADSPDDLENWEPRSGRVELLPRVRHAALRLSLASMRIMVRDLDDISRSQQRPRL